MIDIKFLLNSDIRTILEKYYFKPILCRFLLHIIKDSKNFYNNKENPKVLETQDRVIELLGDLILGKEVSSKELEAAYATASAISYAVFCLKKTIILSNQESVLHAEMPRVQRN